jgi:hypothetical protein
LLDGAMCVFPIVAAIKQAGGKTDSESLISALEGLKFHSPKGEMYFRKEDHLLVGKLDFCKIVPSNDAVGAKVVDAQSIDALPLAFPPQPGQPFDG